MQFFFATPQRLHRVHSHFFMVVRSVTEGGFLFAHSHVSSVSIEVGTGFCPIFGIWQDAGTPATSQMRCWLLPNGRIFPAAAGFHCVGLAYCTCIFHVARTLAQRWLFLSRRARTRCRSGKPHTAATRASRRRTVSAAKGCKDANRSRCYPLALLLRQAPEPLVGAALRKNAEISLCDFQRPR